MRAAGAGLTLAAAAARVPSEGPWDPPTIQQNKKKMHMLCLQSLAPCRLPKILYNHK